MDVHAFLVSILLKMYLFSHNIRYLLNIVQHTLNKGYQSIMVLVHKTPPLFFIQVPVPSKEVRGHVFVC